MLVLGSTDVGKKRDNNEDNYCIFDGKNISFGIVCDGVGGYRGGEIASKLVCEALENSLKSAEGTSMSSNIISEIIKVGMSKGYMNILSAIKENNEHESMSSTVAGAVINNDEAIVFWAGDSRVYLLRGETLTRITKDHSYVEELIDDGIITRDEAFTHPKRNYITNSISAKELPNIEFEYVSLEQGDWLLVCSDGVNDYIKPSAMAGVVAEAVVKKDTGIIIEKALLGGGGDNITAILMRYEGR